MANCCSIGAYAVNMARQESGKAVMKKEDVVLACRASARTIQTAGMFPCEFLIMG